MHGRWRFLACLLPAVLAAACGNFPAANIPPPAPRTELTATLPQLEERVFELVLQTRHDDQPQTRLLQHDAELTAVARLRSGKMAAAASFADTSGDPHVSASLLMARDPAFQGLVGENVAARHFVPGYGIDVDTLAKSIVEDWMNSPRHRENLLFTAYNRGGVGVAANQDTIYVTVLFAAELPLGATDDSAPESQGRTVAIPSRGKDDTKAAIPHGDTVP